MLAGKRMLLVISGGIAAYKALELIRRLTSAASVRAVLTAGGAEFVTPLSVAALDRGQGLYRSLVADRRERDGPYPAVARGRPDRGRAGHRRSAGQDGRGLADDLAIDDLLAADKPVLIAPAMNVHDVGSIRRPSQYRGPASPRRRGRSGPTPAIWPAARSGSGRMAELLEILAAIESYFGAEAALGRPARPRHQRPDPSSRSIRCASSPTARRASRAMPSPPRWRRWARDDDAGERARPLGRSRRRDADPGRDRGGDAGGLPAALPADIAVCAAAVADWRAASAATQKMKKTDGAAADASRCVANPDILATLRRCGTTSGRAWSSASPPRPRT